jgi:hypothetical protein
MSRQNKVNPGMYTQRGRLAQDDAARELTRQRAIASHHTWQPVQRDRMPLAPAEPDDADTDRDAGQTPTAVEKEPARAKAATKATARSAKPAKRSATAAARKPAKPAARNAKPAARKTAAKKVTVRTRGKATTARTAKPKAKAAKRRKS